MLLINVLVMYNLISNCESLLCDIERKEFLRVNEIHDNILQDKFLFFFEQPICSVILWIES